MEQTAVVRPPAAAGSTLFPNGAGATDPGAEASPAPSSGDARPAAAMTPEELALAAAELAELVEHHRRELVDTMAELTRLQRVLRAETRAAIEAIRAAAPATAGSAGAGPDAGTDRTGGPAAP